MPSAKQPRSDRVGVADLDRDEVGQRRQRRVAKPTESRLQHAAQPRVRLPPPPHLVGIVEARQRRQRGQPTDVVVVPAASDRGDDRRRRRQPADAHAREPEQLREGPQRGDVGSRAHLLGDRIGDGSRIAELDVRLVDDDQYPLVDRVQEPVELLGADRAAGRVVRRADPHQARPRADRGGHRLEVHRAVAQRYPDDRRLLLGRVGQVGRKRRPAGHHLVTRTQVRLRQVADDRVAAVAERDHLRLEPVQRRQALDQRAVELGIAARELRVLGDRRDRGRKRPERRLVEGQPDRLPR